MDINFKIYVFELPHFSYKPSFWILWQAGCIKWKKQGVYAEESLLLILLLLSLSETKHEYIRIWTSSFISCQNSRLLCIIVIGTLPSCRSSYHLDSDMKNLLMSKIVKRWLRILPVTDFEIILNYRSFMFSVTLFNSFFRLLNQPKFVIQENIHSWLLWNICCCSVFLKIGTYILYSNILNCFFGERIPKFHDFSFWLF